MFIVIDAASRPPEKYSDLVWQHLWALRACMPVNIVVPTVVSSPCPLLSDEPADAILPASGIQVPRNTAWIPMRIDLATYADRHGDIRLGALEKALLACVDRGDALHDARAWPGPAIGADSRANRRLSILVGGWGELVRSRGADPADFRTLTWLEELADFISGILCARSRRLAVERGHCPAIDLAGARISGSSREMKLRWRSAVADKALRHRNLIAMSAWDVFPRGEPADLRYLDLLPLLRSANCLSFRREVDIEHWNAREFRRFYERVGAVLQCSIDKGQLARPL